MMIMVMSVVYQGLGGLSLPVSPDNSKMFVVSLYALNMNSPKYQNVQILLLCWMSNSQKAFSFRAALPADPLPGALPLDPAGCPRPPL